MSSRGSRSTAEFFATHPVFSLDEAAKALDPPGGRKGTRERLKHHTTTGRLVLVTRGVYAVVPPGTQADRFEPDPFLVAATARPDAIFAYHAALELLGVAHSAFNETALFTAARRRPLTVGRRTIRFLADPGPFRDRDGRTLGTRQVDRRGRLVRTAGPERTLVEGLRRPGLAGGAEEIVVSASGFAVLDLKLLEEVLSRYDTASLWAAVGWFLERFQTVFSVPDSFLARCEARRPKSPHYLERGRRGGMLASRWNLIVPTAAARLGAERAG